MAFCDNCGTQLQEGQRFCAGCGRSSAAPPTTPPQYQQQTQSQQQFQQGVNHRANFAQSSTDITYSIDPADIEKNKAMGGLAYFLFFLPLVACPDSKYGRFHANQGLVYLLLCIAGGIAGALLTTIILSMSWRMWWLTSVISIIIWIPIAVVGIVGLINGFSGKAKELPVIGKLRIIN